MDYPMSPERQYLDLLREVLTEGERREGRNGATYGLFGRQMRFNLRAGFPLLTTKKVHFKSVLVELLWFLTGDTNVKMLRDNGVTIWDEWADADGNLGPVYGYQWRHWYGLDEIARVKQVDQIAKVIRGLREDPFSRRHIVSAWNPLQVDSMALPPCHTMFQFHVSQDRRLSCQLYQRSADMFLGVPFNIASYALLTMMVAQVCDLKLGDFVHTLGDVHLYANHLEQAALQLEREPKHLPTLIINPNVKDIDGFQRGDFTLRDYNPHPAIKAEVSK